MVHRCHQFKCQIRWSNHKLSYGDYVWVWYWICVALRIHKYMLRVQFFSSHRNSNRCVMCLIIREQKTSKSSDKYLFHFLTRRRKMCRFVHWSKRKRRDNVKKILIRLYCKWDIFYLHFLFSYSFQLIPVLVFYVMFLVVVVAVPLLCFSRSSFVQYLFWANELWYVFRWWIYGNDPFWHIFS